MDALSDDARHSLTLIAFIGSVFSPYYAWARRAGRADPLDHCALNVSLHAPDHRWWTLTERRRASVAVAPTALVLGPSSLAWDRDALTFSIDEWTVPLPRRIKGTVRLEPEALLGCTFVLDDEGRHRWSPIAARARVSARFQEPALDWEGTAYFDSNAGDAPLEDAFSGWTWSRASIREGTCVLYDVRRRSGGALSIGLLFDARGGMQLRAPAAHARLARSRWGIERSTRADDPTGARVLRSLEDGPFYARALVAQTIFGEDVVAVHESLSLDRFRSRWVQGLLPFRMPRALR